jgi:hypothetical protein
MKIQDALHIVFVFDNSFCAAFAAAAYLRLTNSRLQDIAMPDFMLE